MKNFGIIGLLLACPVLAVGAGTSESMLDTSVENKLLKKENDALKAEVAALNAQLKNKVTLVSSKAVEPEPIKSSPKVSNSLQSTNLAPGAQTVSLNYKLTDDLHLSVGTKLWINNWEKFFPDAYNKTISVSQSTGTALTPIPTASIKFKDFFITGSYFSQSNYHWKTTAITPAGLGSLPGGTILNLDTDGGRREYDISAGYFLHPNIAVSAGYKDILQKFNTNGTVDNTNTIVYSDQAKVTYKGPILGLIGTVPVGNGFGLYGNFAYGWMTLNAGGYAGIQNRNAIYISADGGVSYSYGLKHLVGFPMSASAFAGYRYQGIKVSNLGAQNQAASDYMAGFVTGLNLAF